MKKAHVEYDYVAAAAAVYPLVTAKGSIVDRFTAQGAREIEIVEHERDGDDTRFVVRYVVDVDVPGFAKKVLSPSSHVTHKESWSPDGESWRGEFEITVKGLPSSITGTSAFESTDTGCRSVIDANIQVSIPLVGGKLEQMGYDRLHDDLAQVDEYLRTKTT